MLDETNISKIGTAPVLPVNVNEEDIFNVKGLAKYLQVGRSTVYLWVKQKRIPHIRIGSKILFKRKVVDKWIDYNSIMMNRVYQRKMVNGVRQEFVVENKRFWEDASNQ